MVLVGILGLLLLAISVKAQIPISSLCINESYLFVYGDLYVSGTLMPINITTYCPYGCVINAGQYGDDCKYSSTDYAKLNDSSNIAIIVGLAFIAFVFAYLSINESKNKTPEQAMTKLQLLYMGLCILFVTAISLVLMKMAEDVGRNDIATILAAIFTILIVFCFIFAILVIIWLLMFVLEGLEKSYKKNYKR
jgi:membrane-associated HD superfamily phosphohydrolase